MELDIDAFFKEKYYWIGGSGVIIIECEKENEVYHVSMNNNGISIVHYDRLGKVKGKLDAVIGCSVYERLYEFYYDIKLTNAS